eukprot:COSAG01_NODE_4954_length_4592_cov_10.344981_1_plen_144_part_00
MPDTQRSVLELCGGDMGGAMDENHDRYYEKLRAKQRDMTRASRGGLKGGQRAVLPACNGQYRCVVCSYAAPNPERLRSHVRKKHGNSVQAKRGRFIGREKNAAGARQYALCVCSADGACCGAGTHDWVRDPSAQAWQAALGLQ